jgi:hypothetical protein
MVTPLIHFLPPFWAGTRINVGGFYVSFILAPLASNASELIARFVEYAHCPLSVAR